jgi:hypothetical protein
MLRKIHETNFFHIKFLDHPNINVKWTSAVPSAQVVYFNSQALTIMHSDLIFKEKKIVPTLLICHRASTQQIRDVATP